MKIDSFSIEGIHYSNEDSLSVLQIAGNKVIAVLADGMGGLILGKVAADLIVNSITDFVCEHEGKLAVQDLLNRVFSSMFPFLKRKRSVHTLSS